MGVQTARSPHSHTPRHRHQASNLHPGHTAQRGGNRPGSPKPQTLTEADKATGVPMHAIRMRMDQPVPPPSMVGWPPCLDVMGNVPVYLGLAAIDGSLQPCKVVSGFLPPVRVPYGCQEVYVHGDYWIVPFDGSRMEWVATDHGRPPAGKRPVEGGREADGSLLFHAIGEVDGVRVVGKAGEHLGGASLPFAGEERHVDYYEVLCWR